MFKVNNKDTRTTPADLVTFIEEILNEKLNFLCSAKLKLGLSKRFRSCFLDKVQTLLLM